MNGPMDEWMDGRTDGWMDGCKKRLNRRRFLNRFCLY